MTAKPLSDLTFTTRQTERQLVTAVLQKWRCSASYDSEVVNQNLGLRLKFSGENRHLHLSRKRHCKDVMLAAVVISGVYF
jgi:hypothetical protein